MNLKGTPTETTPAPAGSLECTGHGSHAATHAAAVLSRTSFHVCGI